MAHTPGPWQRVGWKPCGIYGPGDLANAERICQIDSRQEHDANARLIAAAPDLLAMVRALLERHIAHHNNPLHAEARLLIAQVEGRDA